VKSLDKIRRFAAAVAKNPRLLSPRKDYIFILSHMRGHTSLLSHILGSHPQITGHSEMHQGYSNSLDLLNLRCKVSIDNADTLSGRYVLDKVLNDYLLGDRIVKAPGTKLIFSLREPESTLKSIIAMGRRFKGVDWHSDPRKVLDYYVARLSRLEQIAKTRAEAGASSGFFLDCERLLDDTSLVLHELTQWLGLATELMANYKIFRTTGQLGWGDPSDAILSGRIVKQIVEHNEVELDAKILEAARAPYRHCRETLQSLCRTIEKPPALEEHSSRP
jgi:hypothetical protein